MMNRTVTDRMDAFKAAARPLFGTVSGGRDGAPYRVAVRNKTQLRELAALAASFYGTAEILTGGFPTLAIVKFTETAQQDRPTDPTMMNRTAYEQQPPTVHYRARQHQHQPAADCDVCLQDVRITAYPALVTCRDCIALFTKDDLRAASQQATEPYDC